MTYHQYILSRRWRDNPARLAELEASGFRCRLCNADGTESSLEVHHRTYQNLGNEQVGDLTTLCRRCHHLVTDHQRRLRYIDLLAKISDVSLPLENPAPLFDPTFKEMTDVR
jgi:5-methylcytosine-specific restriction endonuclease McrA